METLSAAEYKATYGKKAGKQGKAAPKAPELPQTPETPPEPASDRKTAQIQWQVAEGIHAEQFPTRFRVVVTGPADALPAFIDHLKQFNP